jgi:hypothetical protein
MNGRPLVAHFRFMLFLSLALISDWPAPGSSGKYQSYPTVSFSLLISRLTVFLLMVVVM